MQNKGFVRFFAISLALVCLFYLSFTFVTNYWDKQAKEIAQGDSQKYYDYLEEISGEEKWLGFTFDCLTVSAINAFIVSINTLDHIFLIST